MKQRTTRAALAALCLAGAGGGALAFGVTAAGAHNDTVTLVASCNSDTGTYQVTGEVANDYALTEVATLTVGTDVTPTVLDIGKNGVGHFSQTLPGNSTTDAVAWHAVWSDGFVQSPDASTTIRLAGDCALPPTRQPGPSLPVNTPTPPTTPPPNVASCNGVPIADITPATCPDAFPTPVGLGTPPPVNTPQQPGGQVIGHTADGEPITQGDG